MYQSASLYSHILLRSAGCSAYFVQISSSADDKPASSESKSTYGTMRTCKMCHDHLAERGLGVMMRGADTEKTTTKRDTANAEQIKKSPRTQAAEIDPDKIESETAAAAAPAHVKSQSSARDILLPLASSEVDSDEVVNETQTESLTEKFAGQDGNAVGEFQALNITKQRLDGERKKREEEARAEAAAAASEEASAAAAMDEKDRDGSGSRMKSRLSSVRSLRWKSSSDSDIRPKGEAETINADSDAVEVSVDQPPTDHGRVTVSSESCGVEEAVSHQGESKDAVQKASQHLGMIAAEYLAKLCRELLQTDAPRLLDEIKTATTGSPFDETASTDKWIDTLMTIATRCCSTVEPDVKNGDFLDIRPYCKVKVISGGSVDDYAYLSGVAFHNNVTDKKMSKTIDNAKIMLLSGGIEYTRTGRVSLDVLLEQEERYMEILVTKIFKLKPNVLLVSRSVSRKAQELLLRANIALIQYVKPTLMTRIARQTGATVLSSIDHITNGTTILGQCRRFRLLTFRDNDRWIDDIDVTLEMDDNDQITASEKKCVSSLLSQQLPNHERQAVLAAKKLGEDVLDGNDAVRFGLLKRGVAKTLCMIEGCPKELGCTVILRGASRPALKQVKKVLRFMINAVSNAYCSVCGYMD